MEKCNLPPDRCEIVRKAPGESRPGDMAIRRLKAKLEIHRSQARVADMQSVGPWRRHPSEYRRGFALAVTYNCGKLELIRY